MTNDHPSIEKAYVNKGFMASSHARPVRILAEYLHPESRFEALNVSDTIVFFGSARLISREEAEARLDAARAGGGDV